MGLMFDQMRTQGSQLPQQNQYLQSNPATDPNANTNWMAPSSPTGSSSNAAQTQSPAPSMSGQGTMLGAMQNGYVGHNDMFNGQNREQWRDAFMGSGNANLDQAKNTVGQMGGQWNADNGTFTTPWGETYDGYKALRTGQGTPAWTPVSGGGMLNPGGQMAGAGNGQMQQGGMFNPQMMQQLMQSLFGGGQGMRQPMNQTSNYFQGNQQGNQGNNQMDISSLLNPAGAR